MGGSDFLIRSLSPGFTNTKLNLLVSRDRDHATPDRDDRLTADL